MVIVFMACESADTERVFSMLKRHFTDKQVYSAYFSVKLCEVLAH